MLPPVFPKKHVMTDEKWTVKDKIIQYKGLVNLFERDSKLLQNDKRVGERKQTKELQQLKKDIAEHRKELTNAIQGDRLKHKNVLGEHKYLQRTFQDQMPEKTLDYIKHKNFIERKRLDRIKYKTKNKLKELSSQKLTCAELKNKYLVTKKTDMETMGEIISGKIQDTNIKLEAALQIKQIYKQILDVMKKDKKQFNYVLDKIMEDICHQSKCIYQATQIGQLATEYTDDRKHEFELLRRAVQRDMKSRMLQIHIAEDQVKDIENSLKLLVRKESISKIDSNSEMVNADNQLHNNIKNLEKILEHIQNITCTNKFEDILPCIQDRTIKNMKMAEILRRSVNDKVTLLNKIKHGKSLYSQLTNTTEESTFEYMQKKIILRQSLVDTRADVQNLKTTLEKKSDLLAKIRSIILHFQQLCRVININPQKSKPQSNKISMPIIIEKSSNKIISMPQQSEKDVFKIMNDIEARLAILMQTEDDQIMENVQEADINTINCYQKFISQISRKISIEDEIMHDALIMEVEPRDASTLTREFVKNESQNIVEQNAKPDWML